MEAISIVPAQLIVGPGTQPYFYALNLLQRTWCTAASTNKQNCFCATCRQLKSEQHPNVVWLNPEKEYRVEDIEIIFEKIRFTLEPGQQFFFVFNKAHTLNPICANRILKTLEEPPAGYRFLLLTNNAQAVIPTIRSRCIIKTLSSQTAAVSLHPLLSFFCSPEKLDDPVAFEKTLREQNLSDTQSAELMHELIEWYEKKIIEACKKGSDGSYDQTVVDALKQFMKKPPQSGSSDLFWKYVSIAFPKK